MFGRLRSTTTAMTMSKFPFSQKPGYWFSISHLKLCLSYCFSFPFFRGHMEPYSVISFFEISFFEVTTLLSRSFQQCKVHPQVQEVVQCWPWGGTSQMGFLCSWWQNWSLLQWWWCTLSRSTSHWHPFQNHRVKGWWQTICKRGSPNSSCWSRSHSWGEKPYLDQTSH